ncbi:hypothetical protein CS542_04660 [Pedobacter sp. IW39]|nr:hypothetical protein CS542_04660 [Pedobacter sp. IW39]
MVLILSDHYFLILLYGDPVNKVGYKGIIAGVLLSAVGCRLFYPPQPFLFMASFSCLICTGLRFTILQITANAYVTLLGRRKCFQSFKPDSGL